MTDRIRLDLSTAEFRELLLLVSDRADLESLRKILSDKLRRMVEHDLYTTYKTAASDADREAARQKYLESKGIPESFRW